MGLILSVAMGADAASLWVATNGLADNPGTREKPLDSIQTALAESAALGQNQQPSLRDPIHIILRDGVYALTSPLDLGGGTDESQKPALILSAASGAHPVISGGFAIKNWRFAGRIPGLPVAANGPICVAAAPHQDGHVLEFRELWVNGRKAVRARSPNEGKLARLVAWDKANQTATIPAAWLNASQNPIGLEMVVDQVWEIAIMRVKSLRYEGSNAMLSFQSPESRLEFNHPWPPVIVTTHYQAPFYLANSLQFLDSPGEWFEDLAAGLVYYWPRAGEDIRQEEVIAPRLETLLKITGQPGQPVSHIEFKGITFAYTSWLRPSRQGHVPLQAGMFLLDARKLSPKGTPYHLRLDNVAWIGRPPAAVSVQYADHVTFTDCTFTHLASAGLDFVKGAQEDHVTGCVFRDIGGNGIQLGAFSETNVETHVPWLPSDGQDLCTNDTIADNFVTDCGNEDWGCVGIEVGYASGITIEHNEVCDLPYTGISLGWGWTKMTNALGNNVIRANNIHQIANRLGDTAGIYTLSAQPGTVISENFIHDIRISPYVPDAEHWFYLYLDEGSSYITVRDNWCPAPRFLKNANGPGNVWENNGPEVSQKIKDAAGLEPRYRDLLSQPNLY